MAALKTNHRTHLRDVWRCAHYPDRPLGIVPLIESESVNCHTMGFGKVAYYNEGKWDKPVELVVTVCPDRNTLFYWTSDDWKQASRKARFLLMLYEARRLKREFPTLDLRVDRAHKTCDKCGIKNRHHGRYEVLGIYTLCTNCFMIELHNNPMKYRP